MRVAVRPTAAASGPRSSRLSEGRRRLLPLTAPALLAGTLALALAVRVVGLAGNPPGFFADEASFGFNAYSILHHGKDEYGSVLPLFFRSFGEYKLPVFIYSQVPVIAALGLTEVAVRLTSALYGTLTVLAVFLLASELFARRTAAVAAAFSLAIMPWHIQFSRTGLGDIIVFPFFLTLGLYLFLAARRHPWLLPAAALAFGVTLYTYRAAWIVLPPLLALLVLLYRRELPAQRRPALAAAAILLVAILPIAVHFLAGKGDRSADVWIFGEHLGFRGTITTFSEHYASYFGRSFLFDRADNGQITRHYLPGFGDLYYVQLPFLLLGLAGILRRPSREGLIVAALLLLYPISGALTIDSPISSRAILGSVVFALLTGYGIALALEGLGRLPRPDSQVLSAALLAAVLAIAGWNFALYLRRYHDDYPRLSAGFWGWQYGPKDVVAYFVAEQDQYDQLLLDPTFNSPAIFFRFYAPDDCRKCAIGDLESYDPGRRQLFALRPESMAPGFDYDIKQVIRYPDNKPALLLVEAQPELSSRAVSLRAGGPEFDGP